MLNSFSDLTVYLVEPSSVQARVITALLTQQGVTRVTHFDTAAAMFERLASEPTALVISALYLPDMTGIDLVQRLRASPTTEHTPFILISSETRLQVLDPVRQSGACGILPKPFSATQLGTALRATLDYLDNDASMGNDVADIADLETLQVLVVDDSASARKFIRRVLENLGIGNFTEAENGIEAIAILNDKMIDLVVTDYNMPEMDGKGLIDYIRTQSWQSSVPILMVTSEQDAGRLAAVEEAGVSGICDKPFEPKTVKALLANILQSRG
jgi:two-component system, chemotaxis family, chemotaxis protein CheY